MKTLLAITNRDKLLCSVCGDPMEIVGLSIRVLSDTSKRANLERDKLIAMFGTSEISVCFCCWFKSLGVNPLHHGVDKKHVGFNFLHRHPQIEQNKDIDADHIIVDRPDWEYIVEYFHRYPEEVKKLVPILKGRALMEALNK